MRKSSGIERRQYPRLDHELPIKLSADEYGFTTSTKNISCVGAYCHINKYVPPFTKVMVKLTLPIKIAGKEKQYTLECKGVLVRTEDEKNGGFNIAIFFNNIKDVQRKKISQYISQLISKETAASVN